MCNKRILDCAEKQIRFNVILPAAQYCGRSGIDTCCSGRYKGHSGVGAAGWGQYNGPSGSKGYTNANNDRFMNELRENNILLEVARNHAHLVLTT